MSVYPPPTEINDIFNPAYYQQDTGQGITQKAADLRYLKLSGGALTGMCTFQTGLTSLNQIVSSSGTVALPSYSFSSDPDTGISNILANQLDFSTSGISRLTISTTAISPNLPILAPDGSVGSPTYAFASSTGTGMYNPTNNRVGFTCNGILNSVLSSTAFTLYRPLLNADGTATIPALTFLSENNLGIYRQGLGNLSFSVSGAEIMRISSAGLIWYNTNGIRSGNGNASACAFNFNNSINTGLYYSVPSSVPTLNIATNGVRRAFFNTSGFAIGDLGDPLARKNFGSYTFTAPNLNQHGTTSTTITYTNAFASAPRIYLSTSFNSATSTYMYGVLASASDVGTTTFKINICNLVNNSTTGDITVNWIAEL
jgi:hypothetical protein